MVAKCRQNGICQKERKAVILMPVVCCRNCGLKVPIKSKAQLADKSSQFDLEIRLRNPQQIQHLCTFPIAYCTMKSSVHIVTKNMLNALQKLLLSCQHGVNNMFMFKTFFLSNWQPLAHEHLQPKLQ